MPVTVVSSQTNSLGEQRDGRNITQEKFILSDGQNLESVFVSPVGFDAASHLTVAGTLLLASLTQAEIDANVAQVMAVGSLANPTLSFSTASANFDALRAAYANAVRVEAVMIGDFLGTLTDANLRNAFGMTQNQVNNLRINKLTPAASFAASIRAAVGQ